jgi:hypothetical protein
VKCIQQECGFNDTYGDGSSVTGFVSSELVTIGKFNNVQADLGSITTATPNFETVFIIRRDFIGYSC